MLGKYSELEPIVNRKVHDDFKAGCIRPHVQNVPIIWEHLGLLKDIPS